ncbi:MAG: amidohydrolase family protein [Chryseolinea sp.]
MSGSLRIHRYLAFSLLILFSCKQQKENAEPVTAFIGATIIDGNGKTPIRDAILLVQRGRIISLGSRQLLAIPNGAEIIDLSGKTIMPGIINAHGHVGDVKGIEGGHYSKKNIIDNLSIYARYGVTTVVSLGGDKKASEDIRAVNDTTSFDHARLFIAGDIIDGKTPAEALALVDSNDHIGVDFMKIRVDDNLGTSPKMPVEIYKPVIDHAHELGYKIATHMYYLEDARKLLESGSDMLAHSVRDKAVDDSFIKLAKEKNVPYCATFTRELSTFVYGDTADFFSDPFFLHEYGDELIKPLLDPEHQKQIRESRNAKIYREQLPVAMANLKRLSDAGVHIVFGTDSGVPTRFMGYFEHIEMTMMSEAGLNPMEIIMTASKNAAEFMGLKDLGTLSAGHWADFIVLDADPLADIRNARKISAVYIGGKMLKR